MTHACIGFAANQQVDRERAIFGDDPAAAPVNEVIARLVNGTNLDAGELVYYADVSARDLILALSTLDADRADDVDDVRSLIGSVVARAVLVGYRAAQPGAIMA